MWVIWFVITFSYYGFFSWIPTLLVDRGITITKSFEFSIIIYLGADPRVLLGRVAEREDRPQADHRDLPRRVGDQRAYWLSQMNDPVWIIGRAVPPLSFFLNGTYAGLYAYTPEVFPTWVRATGTGLSTAFGRIGSITAPSIIGVFAAELGFAGVFGLTTAVLAVGVVTTLLFARLHRGQVAGGHHRTDRPRLR